MYAPAGKLGVTGNAGTTGTFAWVTASLAGWTTVVGPMVSVWMPPTMAPAAMTLTLSPPAKASLPTDPAVTAKPAAEETAMLTA